MPEKLPKLTYSTREVAMMLGVSRPTVDRLVANGRLPSVDLGRTRRTLIPAWAIEELIQAPAQRTIAKQVETQCRQTSPGGCQANGGKFVDVRDDVAPMAR